jgi:hypothetical protein
VSRLYGEALGGLVKDRLADGGFNEVGAHDNNLPKAASSRASSEVSPLPSICPINLISNAGCTNGMTAVSISRSDQTRKSNAQGWADVRLARTASQKFSGNELRRTPTQENYPQYAECQQ